MAKVPFSKLQAVMNSNENILSYSNKAGEEIKYEVKSYLPFKEKLELVSSVINQSVDENGFYNPMRVKLYMTLETVYAYTNLSFTEKMKEDPFKLYDILTSSGIFNDIVNAMVDSEWEEIQENIWDTIENIYHYKNSIMGILDTLKSDYSSLDFDATAIQEKLADPENMQLLKDVMAKLG